MSFTIDKKSHILVKSLRYKRVYITLLISLIFLHAQISVVKLHIAALKIYGNARFIKFNSEFCILADLIIIMIRPPKFQYI